MFLPSNFSTAPLHLYAFPIFTYHQYGNMLCICSIGNVQEWPLLSNKKTKKEALKLFVGTKLKY